MTYEIIRIPWTLEERYEEMSKARAKEFFEWLKSNVDYRMRQLDLLVRQSGEVFDLDFSPDSLLPLGYVLKREIKIEKKSEEAMRELVESVPDWLKESVKAQDEELSGRSVSIVFDLAIYFSHVLMKADSRIKWKMFTDASKLNVNRNQLILKGTSKVESNPIRSMKLICFEIATGEEKPTRLREHFDVCINKLIGS